MRILALDLGTKTGWACNLTGRLESGVQVFDVKRGESPGMRFLRFNAWLAQVCPDKDWLRPEIVIYEMPHHRGGAATEVTVGMSTRVLEFCAKHKIEHSSVHSGTLKKFVTGSGKGDKSVMALYALKKKWISSLEMDDNEVDALCLFHYAQQEIVTA
jgi:Holliday junction resolvasome RuvABC endonuclease subunit